MAKMKLSFASSKHDRVEPLMNGAIEIEGAELVPQYSSPAETFYRQLKFHEFQACEMSISSYIIAKSQGSDMMAIPVFPSRSFFQTWLFHNVDSGIKDPKDITGKRIGVPEYQQTAALWARGIIEHDFGVSQYQVDWYMERTEAMSHGGATGFTPPAGIRFHRVPDDKSLVSMLLSQELDVVLAMGSFRGEGNALDRSARIRGPEANWNKVQPVFPDIIAEGTRFYKQHGFIPANHTYIIRGDVYRENPWLALNLYKAFQAAKDLTLQRLSQELPTDLVFGPQYLQQTRTNLSADPFPYGVKANRAMLEAAIDYSFEQGLIKKKPALEELFAASTLEL